MLRNKERLFSDIICLCGQNDYKDYHFDTKEKSFDVIVCRCCSLGRTIPAPLVDQKIEEYYEDREDYQQRLDELILWDSFAARLLTIVRKYAQGPKLVDVGCNIGVFVNKAREAHFDAEGIDIAQKPLTYGVHKFGFKTFLHYGTLKDQIYEPESIDILTYQHCFEHLIDPQSELKTIHKFLNSKGIVIIEVPRFFSTWRLFLGNRWYGFSPDQHFWQFGKRGLTNLLKREGFKIVAVKGRFSIYHKVSFSLEGFAKLFLHLISWLTATGDNLIVIASKNR